MSLIALKAPEARTPAKIEKNTPAPGQVFTPPAVADWMAKWVCTDSPRAILDPALGAGVFIECVSRHIPTNVRPAICAYELDPRLAERFRTPKNMDVAVRCQDFLRARITQRYDAIIANPPYVRHHDFHYDESIWKSLDRECSVRLNRTTNLYGLFLVRIWSLLADRGRAAIITPAEWLNADFGGPIKAALLQKNAIEAIICFDHHYRLFADAMTTAAIVLLRRGRKADAGVRLIKLRDMRDLANLRIADRKPHAAALTPASKWTPCFEPNAVSTDGPCLGEIARCVRGIATGANDYFALRTSEIRRWGLAPAEFSPCITKAPQVRGDVLDNKLLRQLERADERLFLLTPNKRPSPALVRYLKHGRKQGIHQRYLPAHRPIWYVPENREPAPLLISVFMRGPFRVVLNSAGALNLTAYHGIYPRTADAGLIRMLWKYLRSDEGQSALRRHARIYADGLFKLEPRDVEAVSIPQPLVAKFLKGARRAR